MHKDPICGMAVDDKSQLRSVHEGQTYMFCSPACKTAFDKDPERYAVPVAAGEHRKEGGR